MVESLTQNYKWTKPEVTKSPTTWGGYLNDDLDSIDAVLFAAQNAGVPIGSITMWGGETPPPNWLLCDGSSLPTTGGTYDALFAVLQYKFGGSGSSFSLPNFTHSFPLGAGPNPLGQYGGSLTCTITTANLPAHSHPAWQAAHTHGVYQDAHSHAATQPSHNHGDYGHGHGVNDPGHVHDTLWFVSGQFGVGNSSPNNVTRGGANNNTSAVGTGISIGTGYANLAAAQPAITVGNAQPAVHCDTQTPAVATGDVGGGADLSVIPPYLAINFIIRFK